MRRLEKPAQLGLAMQRVVQAVLVVLTAAAPAFAEEAKWTLRAGAAWVAPSGDDLLAALPAGGRFRFAVDDGLGVGFEAEYRLKPRWGIELAAIAADLDASFTLGGGPTPMRDSETSAFELFSVGASFHPRPGRSLDFHVGAFVAITYFDDVIFLTDIGRSDKLVFDDDVGFGLKLGLDRSFGGGERWLGSLSVRYVKAILEGEIAGQDGDLDPVVLSVGLGYRF